MLKRIRRILRPVAGTPFHPQWLIRGGRSKLFSYLRSIEERKIILDIGCFDKWPKTYIPTNCSYIGLDYYETARNLYHSIPDVYGDALKLPIKSETINTVLLFDVLEHISDTEALLSEVCRVLESDGMLILQVPFLYPLHDEPRDYVRLTSHGFKELAVRNGFIVEECNAMGHPIETSTLLINIALSKTMLGWMKDKNPAAVLVILLPVFVLLSNLLARIFAMLSNEDPFMPYSYQLIFRKQIL